MDGGGWFERDEANEGHILEHGVEPYEVEEAISDPVRTSVHVYGVPRERRYGIAGATRAGRILFVVYAMRENLIRPVTAHEAGERDKRHYRENKRRKRRR